MSHASLRAIGPLQSGPIALLDALEDAVGHHGTLLMILGCECDWDWLNRRPESKRVVYCLDVEHGIVDWPGEDYFATILRDYLATSRAKQGRIGQAA